MSVGPIVSRMYSVTVSRTFVAQHYLTVPDPGPEGVLHSHTFSVDATLAGPELGEYGYLIDIDEFEAGIDATADAFRDETLNELPGFDGNPSAERLAKRFGDQLLSRVESGPATTLRIDVQEDDVAAVSHRRSLEQ